MKKFLIIGLLLAFVSGFLAAPADTAPAPSSCGIYANITSVSRDGLAFIYEYEVGGGFCMEYMKAMLKINTSVEFFGGTPPVSLEKVEKTLYRTNYRGPGNPIKQSECEEIPDGTDYIFVDLFVICMNCSSTASDSETL